MSHIKESYFLSICLLALSTSPGLGYGRCWNKGPDAVTSTPVLAAPGSSRPVDHVPLKEKKNIDDLITFYTLCQPMSWISNPRFSI